VKGIMRVISQILSGGLRKNRLSIRGL
jgi:hypothetical protein